MIRHIPKGDEIRANTLIFLAIGLLCCVGCGSRDFARKTGKVKRIEKALKASTPPIRTRIALREEAITYLDSLTGIYSDNRRVEDWKKRKSDLLALNRRDRRWVEVDSLENICCSEDKRVHLADSMNPGFLGRSQLDTASVRELKKLGAQFFALGLLQRSLDQFIDEFPHDIDCESARSKRDSVQSEIRKVYGDAVPLIYLEVYLLGLMGELLCTGVSEVWRTAIVNDMDFDRALGRLLRKLEKGTGGSIDTLVENARISMRLFEPPKGQDARQYEIITDMFVIAQNLIKLGRSPRGSLLSYNQEVSLLRSRFEECDSRLGISKSPK